MSKTKVDTYSKWLLAGVGMSVCYALGVALHTYALLAFPYMACWLIATFSADRR